MARALAVSRVRVPPPAEPEYVRIVAELARLSEMRGRHLWLFRRRGDPGAFLECSESASVDSHRWIVEAKDDERRLETRLRELATYAPDARELWEEVAL